MESEIIISPYHKPDNIKDVIYEVRGQKVMLDTDLAEMYEVEVSQLKPKSVIRLYRVGQNSPRQTIYLGKQSGFSGNERGIGHAYPLIWRSRQEC